MEIEEMIDTVFMVLEEAGMHEVRKYFWQKFFNFIRNQYDPKRSNEYVRQPWDELTEEDVAAVMKMKAIRVKYARNREKRWDDLRDLLIYTLYLLQRVEDEDD